MLVTDNFTSSEVGGGDVGGAGGAGGVAEIGVHCYDELTINCLLSLLS